MLYGFISIPASPITSGIEERSDEITGTPHAIASKGGIPNPSYKEGYTKTSAALYKKGNSSSETYPVKTIFSLPLFKLSLVTILNIS